MKLLLQTAHTSPRNKIKLK